MFSLSEGYKINPIIFFFYQKKNHYVKSSFFSLFLYRFPISTTLVESIENFFFCIDIQTSPDDTFIRKSDIEALIKAINAKSSNISVNALNSIHNASHTVRSLIIDSWASYHMIRDARLISDIKPALGSVVIANGDRIPIEGVENMKLFDKESQAFYMPTFTSNLLSVKSN